MHWKEDDAVTPVVGTVLILLITMAGIGAVLAWGIPSITAIQDQSSLSSMKGEFSDVRRWTLGLTEIDTAHGVFIAMQRGDLGLEEGSRFAIHATHNDTFPDAGSTTEPACDVRVTGWSTASDTLDVEEVGDCGTIVSGSAAPSSTELEFKLDRLAGSGFQSRPGISVSGSGSSWSVTSSGDDLSDGNWRLQLIDADDDPHVQVYILGTDRLAWHLTSSESDMDLYVEGGALWHVQEPQVFNLAPLPVKEDVFGSSDYLLHFATYSGDPLTVGSPSTPDVFLKLLGNHGRVSGLDTFRLRYDVAGDLAEAWCNHLVFRSNTVTVGTYTEDASATCLAGDADGVRSVTYEPVAADFPFEFIHKRVHAGIIV